MFTGIVEELGEITRVEQGLDGVDGVDDAAPARLTIRGPLVTEDAKHGDSIAVNGVCLTVTDIGAGEFTVDVVPETQRRTSLVKVGQGSVVNLERAMLAGGRFGGHIMQGHVDGTGTFLSRDAEDVAHFAFPPELGRYLVEKGSIAIDGVSLTVASVSREEFTIALIPTTLAATNLGRVQPGDPVNLEVDVVAKYLEKLAAAHLPGTRGDNNGTAAGKDGSS